MKVKEVADLVGISVRTLHHYDEIGLLSPKKTSENRYRIYSSADLEVLQQILFFKELGFPLKQIKQIIHSPSFHKQEALALHRKMLIEKRNRLNEMIETVEKTMKHQKGEIMMTEKQLFKGFDFRENRYEQEARGKWGDEMVDQMNTKINRVSAVKQQEMANEMNEIFRKLAAIRSSSPASDEVQRVIAEWYAALNNIATYSLEAFKGLGQLYVEDERFTENIDTFGEGLAQLMCEAMIIFADNYKE